MKRTLMALGAAGTFVLGACNSEKAKSPEPEAAAAPAAGVALAQKDPLLSAVGLGVSDLAKSTDFYVSVMGMEQVRSYHLDYMDEELLRFPDNESYLVLMHWTDGSPRNYKDLPVKVVTRSKDPATLQEKIRAAGYAITRAYAPSEAVGGAAVGLAKDPDGYVLELLPLRTAAIGPATSATTPPAN